jgi:hypothetical protein
MIQIEAMDVVVMTTPYLVFKSMGTNIHIDRFE